MTEQVVSEAPGAAAAAPRRPVALDGERCRALATAAAAQERRGLPERRQRLLWSLFYGGWRPRRRRGRRNADQYRPIIDWHGPGLLASVIFVLLLCSLDAVLTLALIAHGAAELNPFMGSFVNADPHAFAVVKLAITGGSLIMLVAIARFRIFRRLRVEALVHFVFVAYLALVGYEVWLLTQIG